MNLVETMALLRKAGFTQPEIAEACGCAQSTVSDIANGKNTDPRHSIVEAIRELETKAKRKLHRAGEVH